jgi:predicted secreted protein
LDSLTDEEVDSAELAEDMLVSDDASDKLVDKMLRNLVSKDIQVLNNGFIRGV